MKYGIYVSPGSCKKCGISERRVQKLCEGTRIPGVSKLGYMWLILEDEEKPIDGWHTHRKIKDSENE